MYSGGIVKIIRIKRFAACKGLFLVINYPVAKQIILFFILSLFGRTTFAQAQPDTAFVATAEQNVIGLYEKALRAQSRLYNGSRYVAPDYNMELHPWFSSDDWITGSVFYDGKYFQDVPLMYDLYQGVLVTEHYPSAHAIQLVDEKLQHFTIDGHHFERISNESVGNSLPATDFYEILYSGETKVIVRRQKTLREQIVSQTVERSFEEKNRYFLMRNGIFFPVKSKSSVLKLMSNRKQEIKKYLKQEKLIFADNRERALATVAEYYDTLE